MIDLRWSLDCWCVSSSIFFVYFCAGIHAYFILLVHNFTVLNFFQRFPLVLRRRGRGGWVRVGWGRCVMRDDRITGGHLAGIRGRVLIRTGRTGASTERAAVGGSVRTGAAVRSSPTPVSVMMDRAESGRSPCGALPNGRNSAVVWWVKTCSLKTSSVSYKTKTITCRTEDDE